MSTITKPVGGPVPNLVRAEVMAVQKLLNKNRSPPLPKIAEDGLEGPETTTAIGEFQKRVVKMARPDSRVDPDGATWRALSGGKAAVSAEAPAGDAVSFPFATVTGYSWMTSFRAFASNRSGGKRAHAGCDLYYPKGTFIHAVKAGRVVRGPYAFYASTYALEVDHGTFLVRYGEVQSHTLVKEGDTVVAGQKIAKVGHLVGISVPSDMLHFELYSKAAGGALTVGAGESKKRADGVPFLRRSDLLDPTSLLNRAKANLPAAG